MPYIDVNRPQVYPCPLHPDSPSHLPRCTPPGCHRALALGALRHTSNSHWLSILIWSCRCFNAMLSNHPIFFFSHWVRKSVLYVCLLLQITSGFHPSEGYTVPLVHRGFGSLSFRCQWKWQWCLRSIKDVSHGFSPKRHSSRPSLRAAPWAQDERAGWSGFGCRREHKTSMSADLEIPFLLRIRIWPT